MALPIFQTANKDIQLLQTGWAKILNPIISAFSSSSSLVPSGVITAFGGTTAPDGWLLCDGSQVSRSQYSSLFKVLGIANGQGDGKSTFHLPDLRGRFPRGVTGTSSNDPDASSRTAAATGGNTGNNIGSVQSDQYKSHTHNIQTVVLNLNTGSTPITCPGNTNNVATSASGGNETRPKNIYVNYIIKI